MKLGFICLGLPGHLNPMTTLARQLQAHNHEVVFLYSSGAGGLPFVPSPEKDHINENRPEASRKQGEDALQFSVRAVLAQTEAILKSLPAIVRANGIDALIIDTIQFYAELGALQLGMPYVHVSTGVHHDYSGYTPLCLYGWPHETTPAALARNREGVAKWTNLLKSVNGGVKAYAESIGLKIDWNDLDSTVSPFAFITHVPRAFDFESSHWPSTFHHTGPFHNGNGREKVDFPWERLTGEPLIYASMGTILNGQVDVFRTIVAAMAKNKNLQLVLSIGDQVDPKQIGPVPTNAIIAKQVPQLELLKQTTVCITHAGLNTVLESLAQGVPQLAIPVTYDQPGVAARIAYHKTGVVTSLDKLTAEHLALLLDEVLTDPAYRENARKLQKAIIEANGLSVAAEVIEESLGPREKATARRKVTTPTNRALQQEKELMMDKVQVMSDIAPTVKYQPKPRHYYFDVALGSILLSGEDTGGAYCLLDMRVAPGKGVPRHTHTREDEALFVISGELEASIGDEIFTLRAGETLIAPRNIPHHLRNSGNVPNHYLIMFSPAGFEEFLKATSLTAPDNAVAPTEPPALAVRNVFELAADYGIQFG